VSDGIEQILEVVRIPRARIAERIAAGEITHALVIVAFTWYFGLGPA
jgi:hypothetical protein